MRILQQEKNHIFHIQASINLAWASSSLLPTCLTSQV
uniref:Uncharacterized protein n=1 Tax=Anguilla anguilla TaxID=7936 RepID=A0A0E9QMU4_ANGAN